MTMPAAPFVAEFRADNEQYRRQFDRRLGAFMHERHGGWDVSAITNVLDQLGDKVDKVDVELVPGDDGTLRVTLGYRLVPAALRSPVG